MRPASAECLNPWRDEHGCAHVVALSGGKDSTALALRLKEIEPREYQYVCTPTGDELPDLGNMLAEGEDFAAVFHEGADGWRHWSLRSKPGGADVSEIARAYGGGGHKHAAGFRTAVSA